MTKKRKKYRDTTEMKYLLRETSTRLERDKEFQEKLKENIQEVREKIREIRRESREMDTETVREIVKSLEEEMKELERQEYEAELERDNLLEEGDKLLGDIEIGLDTALKDYHALQGVRGNLENREIAAMLGQITRSCQIRTRIFRELAKHAKRVLRQ